MPTNHGAEGLGDLKRWPDQLYIYTCAHILGYTCTYMCYLYIIAAGVRNNMCAGIYIYYIHVYIHIYYVHVNIICVHIYYLTHVYRPHGRKSIII